MASIQRKKAVQRRYDRWSRYYDSIDTIPGISKGEMAARDLAASMLSDVSGIVIDVGCGSGLMLPMIASHTGAHIVGIDFSSKMIDIAKRRIDSSGIDADAIVGDTDYLPFRTGSVDGAIATFALTSIPDYKATISEVYRVLKPGGKFVVLDMAPPRNKIAMVYFYPLAMVTHLSGYTYIERDTIGAIEEAGFIKEMEKRRYFGITYLCVFRKANDTDMPSKI